MLQQQIAEIVNEAALNALDENGRCWSGYEPVPGKTPFSKGSCRKISEGKGRSVNEDDHVPSYMNRSSLESIKVNAEFLLSVITDETPVDNWAEDHIATAAHDISQVADYMRGRDDVDGPATKKSESAALPSIRKSLS